MNLEKRIKRNLLGTAGDLPSSTWPAEWKRRIGEGFSGADLKFVSNNDIQRRFVHLYGEAQAAIEFALPIDLRLTAQPGYQVRFLYQPTQQASENPRVVAYFNDGAHFWTRELQTSTAKEDPRDWLICDDSIELNDEVTQPKATLAFESGLFNPFAATADATTDPELDQPIAQEPGWPVDPGDLHFSGKALGTEVSPELAAGVTVFVHLKPLALSAPEPMPELSGINARYWVEKDGRSYMPICRGAGVHHLILPVADDCGWAGGGVHVGTSAYVSFTDPNEAGQAGLHVVPTDPDADDDAQHIAKTWEIRNDADKDDTGVNGKTAILRFESVYHADPHEGLACIVGPYRLDIVNHRLPDFWPNVAQDETIDLHVKVRYIVSGNIEPDVAVEWRHESELLDTKFTRADGWATFVYQPTADTQVIAAIDSPYKAEADKHAHVFDIKTIPTRLWGQFELSVDGTEISPDNHLWFLPGQTYQLTLKPRADSVLIGQDLAFSVDPEQRLQLEPAGDRTLTASGLSWSITTAADASGDFALRLDCLRFKQPPTLNGGVNDLPALSIAEAPGTELDPLAALETLTAVVPHYDGMRGTDKIRVTWTGAAGSPEEGSHTTEPVEVGTVGEKSIPLPVVLIAYSLGRSVTVSYTVTPDGGSESPSSDLFHLAIQVIAEEELLVAKPRMLEAANLGEGAEFDVRNLTADATLRIDSWPHIAHGQRTWIRVEGTKNDGSDYERVWNGTGNWVGVDWYRDGYSERPISYIDLQALRDGSTLTLKLKASFNKSHDEAEATLFPQRTYTIRAALNLSASSIKQATGNAPSQQLNPVAAKDALTVVIPDYGVLPGDQVSVTWTGTEGDGSCVVPAQAVPGNREIEVPVKVIAFNLGRSVTVTYAITRNGEIRPPSAALTLAVQAMPAEALEPSKPRILQAASGGNGTELDVNSVSADVWARVDSWPHVAHEQRTWLRVEGTKIDGSTYAIDLWRGPSNWVSMEWFNRGYGEKEIPYADLLELRDGSTLKLEFKASFNKSTDVAHATTFPIRTYTVRAAFNASAPSIKQASGAAPNQQLNPVAAKDALTVVIPNYGIHPGDQVKVTWAGTSGAGSHTTSLLALPASREIPMPVDVIAYNLGRPVTVTYRVTRDGKDLSPSAPLNLMVQTFAQDDLLSAKPKILLGANEGEGAELDLESVSANTACWVGVWPHIAPDQDVWLRLKGTKADGTVPYDLDIWAPPPRGPRVNPDWIDRGFYEVPAAYSYLKELKHSSTLTMEFKADLSKTTNEANATTFPLRTYTVKLASSPTLVSVKGANDQEVEEDAFVFSAAVNRFKLSGLAGKGQKVEIFDGNGSSAVSKGQATADQTTGLWDLNITVDEGARRLYAKALYPTSGSIYSNVRTFTVVELVRPTLDSVKNAKGGEIPDDGLTVSTSLKLSGQASKGLNVEIFEGEGGTAVSKGQATADRTTGIWNHDITVEVAPCRLYAKSRYHSGNVYSNVRNLTVVPLMDPTFRDVQDINHQTVEHGGYTTSTFLYLYGQASRGQAVEIWVSTDLGFPVYRTFARADPQNGYWIGYLTVEIGLHIIFAKSLYHSGLPVFSNVRTVVVVAG
ncbi:MULTISPECIES: hypothetical protein [unclassified Pseudomonas]|uniref:hypothetical protein n=1 Tax=unclassified Pseudomonas TaxID=196821 RepID=UPI00087191A4|nr:MULTISPECIES: hypothetical protein [unclassified Pseudomonas]SCW87282.1 hypothetical protein SAMN03159481_03037 [Pseudomonas sp. NFACC56-3]SFK63846.1 hypothetical protein SAMN03159473_03067 [Pseudomonas sp. NFACC52]